jgi:hypothetical protein
MVQGCVITNGDKPPTRKTRRMGKLGREMTKARKGKETASRARM